MAKRAAREHRRKPHVRVAFSRRPRSQLSASTSFQPLAPLRRSSFRSLFNLARQRFISMTGTRNTRSRPQSLPAEENTPTELAAPKRSQRGRKRTLKPKEENLPTVENGETAMQVTAPMLDGLGDKMELDTGSADGTKIEDSARVIDDDMHVNNVTEVAKTPDRELTPRDNNELAVELCDVEIRRSARKRIAPTVLDEVVGKAAKSKTGGRVSAWKTTGANEDDGDEVDVDSEWEEEYLMTNPGSVYASNLHSFFRPPVWEKFTPSEQAHLLRFLPECDKVYPPSTDVSDTTTPQASLADDFWGNPQLIARISHVEADIADGKYMPENQAAIIEARKRAEAGEFNEFKDNKFEQFWGQKQRVNYEAVAGDTREVKITTLAKHQALKVGDVFSLRRTFMEGGVGGGKGKEKGKGSRKSSGVTAEKDDKGKGKGKGNVTVEKDAKLIAIDPEDFTLTFSYPPGKLQFSSDNTPDKIISNVASISALETLLCKEDGRAPSKLPNGNAFKTFRIKRNTQDIGSLFDVRTEFHAKYISPKAD